MTDKPSWKEAPEWAEYLAQDSDGQWFWYEKEPVQNHNQWVVQDHYSNWAAYKPTTHAPEWAKTLEKKA